VAGAATAMAGRKIRVQAARDSQADAIESEIFSKRLAKKFFSNFEEALLARQA